ARRDRAAPGRRGADRHREVRVQAARLVAGRRDRHLDAPHPAQRDPPRPPRAAPAAQPHDPPDDERPGARVLAAPARRALPDRRGGHRRRGRQPRPPLPAGVERAPRPHLPGAAAARGRAGPVGPLVRRPRRAVRRELRLGPGRLRPARADAPGRARGPREDAVTFPRDARPVPVPGRGAAAGPAPVPPVTAPVPIAALPPRPQPSPPVDARPGLSDDPDWYRTAVFYEVIVRAFSDSDGSGTGDLRGLIDRLD